MEPITAGWRRAAVFDPATGTVVRLNTLIPEGCDWGNTPVGVRVGYGERYVRRQFRLALQFTDTEPLQQLEQWMFRNTRVHAVIEGENGLAGWWEGSVPMVAPGQRPDARAGAVPSVVVMTYEGQYPNIATGRNLIQMWRGGWYRRAEADRADMLTGALSGDYTAAFDNTLLRQSVVNESPAAVAMAARIPWPLGCEWETLFGCATAALDDTYSIKSMALRSLDFAGSPMQADTASPFGASVALELSFTDPEHYWYEWKMDLTHASGGPGVELRITEPYLRLDRRTGFTRY